MAAGRSVRQESLRLTFASLSQRKPTQCGKVLSDGSGDRGRGALVDTSWGGYRGTNDGKGRGSSINKGIDKGKDKGIDKGKGIDKDNGIDKGKSLWQDLGTGKGHGDLFPTIRGEHLASVVLRFDF